ncbi:MAG TPA: hypothetical protein VF784_13025, partial [Anaerolineales bacterium]
QTPYQLQAGRTATSTLNAPTVGPTQEAPSQATASPSPTVAPSPDPMVTSTPKQAAPICGSAVLVPIALFALAYARPGFKNRRP